MAVCVLLKRFSTCVYIGVLNTLIHGSIFLTVHGVISVRQSVSNICAFAVAATFSFYANSRYTLKRTAMSAAGSHCSRCCMPGTGWSINCYLVTKYGVFIVDDGHVVSRRDATEELDGLPC
ncbi:GtrA family protein [Pseudomonas sp. QS1027]|uniref:GtrA family protein n=1 Tax=unclassified Pseudomonas TaxID=196821 RepID=UPI00353190A5